MERVASPEEVRLQNRTRVSSNRRTWKIKGRPGAQGAHVRPVHWKITASDVTAGGVERYIENVRRWAEETMAALRESSEIPN